MSRIVNLVDVWTANRKATLLPSVEELCTLVNRPLADSEKVSIFLCDFEALRSCNSPDMCSDDDLDALFKVGERDCSSVAWTIYPAVLRPPPDGTGAFLSFWDDNLRRIIELLLSSGKTIRNSNYYEATEVGNLHPDFGFLMGNACPFRGEEEEGTENAAHPGPRAELVDKLRWVYSPAPYLLGKAFTLLNNFPLLNYFP